MAVSKANQRAVAKYMKNNYDDIKIRVYKGQRDILQAYTKQRGISVNTYIQGLIRADMEENCGDIAAWDALAPTAVAEEEATQ